MKNSILTFVIGILLGAVVATLGWMLYIKAVNAKFLPNNQMMDEPLNNSRPQMPQDMEQGGENPPNMPNT